MRISSSQYFSMNVETMSNQQAQLSQIYQQISSGTSLSTAADNPLGAAQAVQQGESAESGADDQDAHGAQPPAIVRRRSCSCRVCSAVSGAVPRAAAGLAAS